MYKTCLNCKRPLGENEAVEHFPIGRRLAFDEAKGRLWVVCRKCLRWNLTPLEERWEAIEECERIFRDTPVRVSTENIGIARHGGGLDLVRIGKARPREFAAWRYGDLFRRRWFRWQAVLYPFTCAHFGGSLAIEAGWFALPAGVGAAGAVGNVAFMSWFLLRTVGRVRLGSAINEGAPDNGGGSDMVRFRFKDLRSMRLVPGEGDADFAVELCKLTRRARFEGADARRVATAVISAFNPAGGPRDIVRQAVREVNASGHPSRLAARVAERRHKKRWRREGSIGSLPHSTKLALEMALHEERERRALAGELWVLEQAWKEAEEIAAISDSLLLPAGTDEFFRRHGARGGRIVTPPAKGGFEP